MTGFLTFSVYSLRISTDLPVQSMFLPKISVYFICSIIYNIFAMFWHITRDRLQKKKELPKWFIYFCEILKKVFCFPQEKKDKNNKIEPNNVNAINGAMITVETSDQKDMDISKSVFQNPILPKPTTITADSMQTVTKKKCNQCDRCEECDTEYKKEKDKNKKKKEIEENLEAMNYFFLILMIIAMFISQMAIWLTLTQ